MATLVLVKFSEAKLSREERKNGTTKKGQATYHLKEGEKTVGTLTRHIQVVGDRGWGRAANYYGLGGAFAKQNEAADAVEDAEETVETSDKKLHRLLERAETMKEAFDEQEERGEEVDSYDQLAAEITTCLVNEAGASFKAAEKDLSDAKANQEKIQKEYPLVTDYKV